MSNYKVLCIDMFETLVSISERSHVIWKRILQDDYTEDLRIKYSRLTSADPMKSFISAIHPRICMGPMLKKYIPVGSTDTSTTSPSTLYPIMKLRP